MATQEMTTVTIRIPTAELDEIRKDAERNDRSLNREIRRKLSAALQARSEEGKPPAG